MAESYITVGKLGKPHGISGAFRFLLSLELKSKNRFPKYFVLTSGNHSAPQFINKIEWIGEKDGIITFEEINSRETAKRYNGSAILLLEKDITSYFKKEDTGEHDLTGFLASDETEGLIGRIHEMIESPGQILLSIEDKDILIPLVDEFIVKINRPKREILFRLPEGLLDL
ncbi:MAG: 16S rRNA processing protein RimM [Bacteroidetes bacterium]|nr:16S rRNA processing protein RimM [Bacteroidota bacterium]